jgi:hypothetical protein
MLPLLRQSAGARHEQRVALPNGECAFRPQDRKHDGSIQKKPTTRPNYCVPGAVGTRRQKLPPHSGPPSSGRSGLSPDRSDRLGSPRSWYCPESLGMRYVDSRASIPSCFRAVANSSAGYHERVSVPHYAIWSSLRPGGSAGDHIKSRGSIPATRW